MLRTRLASVFALGVLAACGGGGGHQNGQLGDTGDASGGSGGDDGPGGVSGGSGLPGCAGLPSTCGPSGNESCCASSTVPGGTFYRGYDGASYTDMGYPATVSSFQLDRFLATVGRFRSFVTAVESGWLPDAGSGKHTHLNGGGGLNGGTEQGWDPAWNDKLAKTRGQWDRNLLCDPTYQTWTSDPGSNEQRPVNCVVWEEAYAFCIWDGGFLPTEAESNYAAAGGPEQRVYAWSSPAKSTSIDCSYANFTPGSACSPGGLNDVGSESPKGDGKWGQADLAGNVWEWMLDWYASPYAKKQCNDCADFDTGGERVIRGGTCFDDASFMAVSYRHNYAQLGHSVLFGVRCARAPQAGK